MRMIARARREEGGAVLVLVALGLVFFILGMLALTVDLGRAVGVKRNMVNAADAAALAAAQQCALGKGSVAAQAAALQTAKLNGAQTQIALQFVPAGACPPGDPPAAGQKFVTVRYGTLVDYFVAPVLGFDNIDVTASATAMWAVPGIVPITVNVVPLQQCDTEDPAPGNQCNIVYPKDTLQNPRWGILDLELWGNASASSCPVPNSEVVNIIQSGGWPPRQTPNWDCVDNGAQFSSWSNLVGGTWWFPVIDVDLSTGHTIPGHNEPCTGADIPALQAIGRDCQITTAWVVKFVQLKVTGVRIVPGTGGTIELDTEVVPPPKSSAGIDIRLVD